MKCLKIFFLCLFLFVPRDYSLRLEKPIFLAPESDIQELYRETVLYLSRQIEVIKEVVSLWLSFQQRNLNPTQSECLPEIFERVEKLMTVVESSKDAITEYSPALEKQDGLTRALIYHLVVYAWLNVRNCWSFMSEDTYKFYKKHGMDFYKAYFINSGRIPEGIIYYLSKVRDFSLIVQKGELLNIRQYSNDPDFIGIERLYQMKDKIRLPANLLPEIDSLIASLAVETNL